MKKLLIVLVSLTIVSLNVGATCMPCKIKMPAHVSN